MNTTTEQIQKLAKDYSTTPNLMEAALDYVGIKDLARFLKGTFSIRDDVKARLLANKLRQIKLTRARK